MHTSGKDRILGREERKSMTGGRDIHGAAQNRKLTKAFNWPVFCFHRGGEGRAWDRLAATPQGPGTRHGRAAGS